jgi:hypothetical protein
LSPTVQARNSIMLERKPLLLIASTGCKNRWGCGPTTGEPYLHRPVTPGKNCQIGLIRLNCSFSVLRHMQYIWYVVWCTTTWSLCKALLHKYCGWQ